MSVIEILPPPRFNVVLVPQSVIGVQLDPPSVRIIAAGNVGPPGPPGQWVSLTQAEYDALSPPDPDTLYVIVS